MGEDTSILQKCAGGGDHTLEGSLKELAKYRMERAKEMLEAAEGNLKILEAAETYLLNIEQEQ